MDGDADQEDRCRRCGECCRKKATDQYGKVYLTDRYCQYLDVKTKRCTVYENRFEVNPNCQTVEEAIATRSLPYDCVYIRRHFHRTVFFTELLGYVPPEQGVYPYEWFFKDEEDAKA